MQVKEGYKWVAVHKGSLYSYVFYGLHRPAKYAPGKWTRPCKEDGPLAVFENLEAALMFSKRWIVRIPSQGSIDLFDARQVAQTYAPGMQVFTPESQLWTARYIPAPTQSGKFRFWQKFSQLTYGVRPQEVPEGTATAAAVMLIEPVDLTELFNSGQAQAALKIAAAA